MSASAGARVLSVVLFVAVQTAAAGIGVLISADAGVGDPLHCSSQAPEERTAHSHSHLHHSFLFAHSKHLDLSCCVVQG